jgi:hypothetical protein
MKQTKTPTQRAADLGYAPRSFPGFGFSRFDSESHPTQLPQTQADGHTNTFSGFGSEPNTFLNNLASFDACPGFAVNTSRMISMIVPPFIMNAFCNEAQQLRNETFSSRQASVAGYLSYRPVQTSEVPFLQQSDEQQSGTHQ